MQSDELTVVVRNLSKTYTLHPNGTEFGFSRSKNRTQVHAIKDVSFVAKRGESIGLIGHNGSGKSTLLRTIAGSQAPSNGEVYVSSTPTLLGVSSALEGSLTGRENVRLGLLALGLNPREVAEREDSVCEWAEIGEAVDRPLKTYSSGMRSRLVFSISTSVSREILLVDEALSTGDSSFKDRAKDRMGSFLEAAGTVFLVSHGKGTIKDYCNRALWLHEGEIIADGHSLEVVTAYVKWSQAKAKSNLELCDELIRNAKESYVSPKIVFDSEAIRFLDA